MFFEAAERRENTDLQAVALIYYMVSTPPPPLVTQCTIAIFDRNVATIFHFQWKIGNISEMFLQYSVLYGIWSLSFPQNFTAQVTEFFWNLIPFCPQGGTTISRNYFLFHKAGYILQLFNYFYYLYKLLVLNYFEFCKVEYIFYVFNSLQYLQF